MPLPASNQPHAAEINCFFERTLRLSASRAQNFDFKLNMQSMLAASGHSQNK
jgi:hypothetical protein